MKTPTYAKKLVAVAWAMLFAVLVGGSIYNKLGRPSLDAASTAVAEIYGKETDGVYQSTSIGS